MFYGYFGHSTILLTRPVVEGSYYMEVEVLSSTQPTHPKGKHFPSFVRIGFAKSDYRQLVPLGGQHSYAYKSSDGTLLHNSSQIEGITGEEYGPGDVMGI